MEHDLHCSNGRVSTMPGSRHAFPEGSVCDSHPDRLAVARVQGETDSMGCEYLLVCQECNDQLKIGKLMGLEGRCDSCHEYVKPEPQEVDEDWVSTQGDAPKHLSGLVLYTDSTKEPEVRLFNSIPWSHRNGRYKRLKYSPGLTLRRDPDEGSAGPLYSYCAECNKRIAERETAEAIAYYEEHPFDDFEWDESDSEGDY